LTGQADEQPVRSGTWHTRFSKLFRDRRTEIAILVLLLVLFAVCASYFALHLKRGVIPDEPSHFYVSTLFSTTWGVPEVTERALTLGHRQFDRFPFLYYWINGRVLHLTSLALPAMSEWQGLLVLRITSVLYSLLSLVFVYFLAVETLRKRWWPLLAVFFTSSTLMFTFMSGGVSYDNLTILCATAGIYYLARTLQGKRLLTNSLMWIFFIGLGALVKKTILPLALVMFICWIVFLIVKRKQLSLKLAINWKLIITTVLTLAVIGVNLSLYGVNLVRYGSLLPKCKELHTPAQCDLSVFKQRAAELEFPQEKLDLWDVFTMKKQGPVNYLSEFWLDGMRNGVYGILGHEVYIPVHLDSYYSLFFFFILLIAVRYWGARDIVFYALLLLVAAYFGTIFYLNYTSELDTDFRHIAIQGRYLFPVLAPFYVLVVEFISRIRHTVVCRLMLAYSLVLFTIGGPAYFLLVVAARNQLNWFV
jgi:4-amino-4-deoxy-L-arabinose transferase-like glycosyltransferase